MYEKLCYHIRIGHHWRGVVPEGAGGVMAPPDSGRLVNPILTRGAGYAHQIILAPPDFQTFLRPCWLALIVQKFNRNKVVFMYLSLW